MTKLGLMAGAVASAAGAIWLLTGDHYVGATIAGSLGLLFAFAWEVEA